MDETDSLYCIVGPLMPFFLPAATI